MYCQLRLTHVPNAELARAVAGIPRGVTSLDLSFNIFNRKLGAELATAFTGIPVGVTSLDLNSNYLSEKTGAELAIAFAGIPVGVTTLNLRSNDFGLKTSTELATAFAGIPSGVTTLDLSVNRLDERTGAELATAFAGIPSDVTTLDLSGNRLDGRTGAELATAFAGIPVGVTALNLRSNDLGQKTGTELAMAFAGIPSGVTTLDLSRNYLGLRTGTELAAAFAGIPDRVTTLDLSENHLDEKTGTELAIAFAGIPGGVTALRFAKVDLHDTNGALRIDLFHALPASITTITVDGQSCHPTDYVLNQILPIEQRENFHHHMVLENTIKPQFAIDENMLIKIINYIQKHPNPIRHVACALLLAFQIENAIDENLVNNNTYIANRLNSAIDFYRKAACDAQLKPKIAHILWDIRTRLERFPTVIEKLKPYKLAPLFGSYAQFQQETEDNPLSLEDGTETPIDISQSSTSTPIYSFWLKLKIFSAISIGAAVITLLCLNTPLLIAITGTMITTAVGYAACRFFVQKEHNHLNAENSSRPIPR